MNMKKIALIAATLVLLLAIPSIGIAQNIIQNATGVCRLTIEVSNMRNDKGNVKAYLFFESNKKGKAEYPTDVYCDKEQTVSIVDGKAVFVFDGLPAGNYAFYLHHDGNEDGKMNANIIGMPTEGYAFSNGAKPGMTGIPNFSASKIMIEAPEMTVRASMMY
jgi:uncharacterized protein (DUF2141 family)